MKLARVTFIDEETERPYIAHCYQEGGSYKAGSSVSLDVVVPEPEPVFGRGAASEGPGLNDLLREEAGVCPDPLEPESAIKEWPELRHVLAHLWGAIESLAGSRPADALDDLASIASQVFWPADDDEREEAISMAKHTHKGGKRPKKNPCKGR